MLIADSRGGLYAALVVEAAIAAAGVFSVVERLGILGPVALVALLWGGLIAVWFSSRVHLTVDDQGLRGKTGFSRLELDWRDVERIEPMKHTIRLTTRDGRELALRVPNLRVADVAERMASWKSGGVERTAEAPPPRYPIPRGVETHLALEKRAAELVRVDVLVAGPNVDAVGKAARVLAVRAADEHRWEPTFSGKIRVLVSALRTPIASETELTKQMDAAIAGARDDLAKKGWTVIGGARFELEWTLMGAPRSSSR